MRDDRDAGGYRLEWVADVESPSPELEHATIRSTSELDEWLDRLSAQAEAGAPFIAELLAPSRAALGLGLGRAASVLTFKAGDDPPYYQSLGGDSGASASRADVAVFYYQGHWTEFPVEALVPNESARDAIRTFFLSGERPMNVLWEEV